VVVVVAVVAVVVVVAAVMVPCRGCTDIVTIAIVVTRWWVRWQRLRLLLNETLRHPRTCKHTRTWVRAECASARTHARTQLVNRRWSSSSSDCFVLDESRDQKLVRRSCFGADTDADDRRDAGVGLLGALAPPAAGRARAGDMGELVVAVSGTDAGDVDVEPTAMTDPPAAHAS
jgi:hypothetical protein